MQVSQEAWIFLGIETFLFLVLLYSLFRANRKLRPLLKGLSRSLRLSEDQFGGETNFVTSARTRYRRAAEQIEEVDAHSIASGDRMSCKGVSSTEPSPAPSLESGSWGTCFLELYPVVAMDLD